MNSSMCTPKVWSCKKCSHGVTVFIRGPSVVPTQALSCACDCYLCTMYRPYNMIFPFKILGQFLVLGVKSDFSPAVFTFSSALWLTDGGKLMCTPEYLYLQLRQSLPAVSVLKTFYKWDIALTVGGRAEVESNPRGELKYIFLSFRTRSVSLIYKLCKGCFSNMVSPTYPGRRSCHVKLRNQQSLSSVVAALILSLA